MATYQRARYTVHREALPCSLEAIRDFVAYVKVREQTRSTTPRCSKRAIPPAVQPPRTRLRAYAPAVTTTFNHRDHTIHQSTNPRSVGNSAFQPTGHHHDGLARQCRQR